MTEFEITFGSELNNDYITRLIPSRTPDDPIDSDIVTDTTSDNITSDTVIVNDTTVNETDATDKVNDTSDIVTVNDTTEDQNISEKHIVNIKCAEKRNKINPNCLKGQYNNLYNILETKMPETDVNNEIETFSKLSDSAQMDLLDDIFKNFDEEIEKNDNSTQIIRNIINKEKYLVNIDCFNFSNERSNNSLFIFINRRSHK